MALTFISHLMKYVELYSHKRTGLAVIKKTGAGEMITAHPFFKAQKTAGMKERLGWGYNEMCSKIDGYIYNLDRTTHPSDVLETIAVSLCACKGRHDVDQGNKMYGLYKFLKASDDKKLIQCKTCLSMFIDSEHVFTAKFVEEAEAVSKAKKIILVTECSCCEKT